MASNLDALPERVERIETKLDALSTSVDRRFEAVDRRFEVIDRRFDAVDQHFAEQRAYTEFAYERLNSRLRNVEFHVADGAERLERLEVHVADGTERLERIERKLDQVIDISFRPTRRSLRSAKKP